jgi:hypothetical protein
VQTAELKQKTSTLRCDIESWIAIRMLYVPAAESCAREANMQHLKKVHPGLLARSWDVKLWLPLHLPVDCCASSCVARAVLLELRLCVAHTETCLAKLWQAHRYRATQVAKFCLATLLERARPLSHVRRALFWALECIRSRRLQPSGGPFSESGGAL